MAYTPTTWNNGASPAINAPNLNKIEQGIKGAWENPVFRKDQTERNYGYDPEIIYPILEASCFAKDTNSGKFFYMGTTSSRLVNSFDCTTRTKETGLGSMTFSADDINILISPDKNYIFVVEVSSEGGSAVGYSVVVTFWRATLTNGVIGTFSQYKQITITTTANTTSSTAKVCFVGSNNLALYIKNSDNTSGLLYVINNVLGTHSIANTFSVSNPPSYIMSDGTYLYFAYGNCLIEKRNVSNLALQKNIRFNPFLITDCMGFTKENDSTIIAFGIKKLVSTDVYYGAVKINLT